MKLGEKIGIVVGVALLLTVVSSLLLKKGRKVWSLAVLLLVLIVGSIVIAVEHSNDKENFDVQSSGCNQTINIMQNCKDPSPGPDNKPWLPVKPLLSKSAVEKWVSNMDPSLTKQCKTCIVTSAMRLWTDETLRQVALKPMDQQQQILKALLLFDCDKQCVIPTNALDKKAVTKWLITVFGQQIDENCFECVVDAIMKLWTRDDFQKAIMKPIDQQRNIVDALWLVHCANCQNDTDKLTSKMVQNWLEKVLPKSAGNCTKCVLDTILRLWSLKDFKKVQKMDKKSQQQMAEALVTLDCNSECINVPTGLNAQAVGKWLDSIMTGENSSCRSCVIDAILHLWSPTLLAKVQGKSKLEQSTIAHGVLMLNCHDQCSMAKLSRAEVENWVKQAVPKAPLACQGCITAKAMQMWDREEFNKVKGLSAVDQAKMATLFADFNCPHLCDLPPVIDANY